MNQYVHGFVDEGFVLVPGVIEESTRATWRAAVDRAAAAVRAKPGDYDTRYTLRTEQETDTWGSATSSSRACTTRSSPRCSSTPA